MIGKTISHFRITGELGGGGMGIVYRATDTRLDRPVALKFLPSELTRDAQAKQRFIHEAKAASALQHHNICTIHEIDETESGHLFIAMDCYEGETLKEKIARGPLPVAEAVDIATQVAAGLQKAHDAGMVHRDIKPANIMITRDGVVKLLDFGIAKLAGQTKMTKTGTTVGTVAYMSPEQATGGDVDHRSDIWSLGVMLYEMFAGVVPFRGDHEAAVLYSIANTEPRAVTHYRSDMSADLERIVHTALRKNPRERYQSAVDMMEHLTNIREHRSPVSRHRSANRKARGVWIAAIFSVVAIIAGYIAYAHFFGSQSNNSDNRKRIAVLPFENIGSAEDDEFSDGMTDEITSRLAAIRELAVIAPTSTMQYKHTAKSIGEIGDELHADYIMRGLVRWQHASDGENKIKVSPKLIRVSDATLIWAGIYEQPVTEIFTLQSDIAARVVDTLGVTLLKNERRLLEYVPTDNLEAYTHYVLGRAAQVRSYSQSDQYQAEQEFRQAIVLDPEFALAYAKLAQVHCEIYWQWHDRSSERVQMAKSAAEKALALQPDLAEAHNAMGHYFYECHLDYDNALAHYQIAVRDKPNDAELASAIGFVQRRQGKWSKALENLTRASELDPRSAVLAAETGYTHCFLRDYETAEAYCTRAIALEPSILMFGIWAAELYLLWDGTTDRAKTVLQHYLDDPLKSGVMFQIDVYDGNYEAALKRFSVESPEKMRLDEGVLHNPKPMVFYRAEIYDLMNNHTLAYACYDSARIALESMINEAPDEPIFHAALGIALAGLGYRDEAIREGKRSVELMPLTREAIAGYRLRCDLARIYTMVGDFESAIEELDFLLSVPGTLSTAMLRLDPVWKPLQELDSFQRLLEKYETKKA